MPLFRKACQAGGAVMQYDAKPPGHAWLSSGHKPCPRASVVTIVRLACLLLLAALSGRGPEVCAAPAVFNVKSYGATGRKEDDARPAIQRAIDACAAAGGGVVSVPAGLYTSGTLHLRSHITFRVERGATLFASPDPSAYDYGATASKAALLFGEELEDVSLIGEGIIDGQAEYEWRLDDFEEGFDHKTLMQKLGKPLLRSFPKDFPKRTVYPHLVWLGRCSNVRISGLNLLHAPSWTFALYGCRHVHFDRLYIYTSLKEAVWADGIDLDGCNDVLVSNSSIETGDDCVALVSEKTWGTPLICENISVTNCRLSSASAGLKFSEGNVAGIRNISVRNTLFNNVNRGVVFLTALGGSISNVLLADLTMNCNRFDWFWAGDGQPFRVRVMRLSELTGQPAPSEAAPGAIRNITVRNVVASAKGSSLFYGHAEKPLEAIHLENVQLYMATDPNAPFDQAEHALDFRRVKDLTLKNVQVSWKTAALATWKSALNFEEVKNLEVIGFVGRGAWPNREAPAVALKDVFGANIRGCRAVAGTELFLRIAGHTSGKIYLKDNDLRSAHTLSEVDQEVPAGAVAGLPLERRAAQQGR